MRSRRTSYCGPPGVTGANDDRIPDLNQAPRNSPVPSPCTGACRLDAERICIGCGRRLHEIVAWMDAGDERRLQIRAAAAARLPRPR